MQDSALIHQDPEIAHLIDQEADRQRDKVELIASENYVSAAVRQATGSILTNKYAEGYPGKRYYGGCEVIDQIEQLAIDRAKQLFGADHANVQPHSGSAPNMAVYFAMLQPGDKVMGLSLTQGGHLTHGNPANFSGKLYQFEHYGVDPETEVLDYDQVATQVKDYKPKLLVAALSIAFAYCSLHKINPPRGPRKVLWVEVVIKSAYGTGEGCKPAATSPAI